MASKRRKTKMKIIKYFKLFESRTAEITDEEFVMLVKDNCKNYLANPKYLQRMKSMFNGKYSYIDPKQHVRMPLMNTEDGVGVSSVHHTLFMDNLPSWKSFPKRSESLIGSLKFNEGDAFGLRCYLVIPYDGANFGLAPYSDLWGSQCKIDDMMYEFNELFSKRLIDLKVSDDSYEAMMTDIQHRYKKYLKRKAKLSPDGVSLHETNNVLLMSHKHRYIDNIFSKFSSEGIESVEEGFDKYFAPQCFYSRRVGSEVKGFKSVEYDGLVSDDKREFWTDSKCLLVYMENFRLPNFWMKSDKMKEVSTQSFSEILKMIGVSDEKIEQALKSVV
jgi:hypothetical protein